MMKRILFVDDDPLLARAYAMVLQSESHRWEVRCATSAAQALELADRGAFDVVVADLRMPGMNGVELIAEIRKRHPQTSRVVLSGIRDQEEVARCLGTTHQFISKPVDLSTLRDTVARICHLDAYLSDDRLRALVGKFEALPSFPALYAEIMKELSSDEPMIDNIAEIVAQDPAMTAKMLQLVNSAAFGLGRRITNPFEAVQFLGTGTVKSLVLSVHVISCYDRVVKGFSMDEFWGHTLRCAALARAFCQNLRCEGAVTEEAYIAGMLHDLGKLMLASGMPDQYQKATQLARERQGPRHAVEAEVFGATHAEVGAYLLGLWGLPTTLVEAVAFHHAPARSEPKQFGALAAVHVADALENSVRPDCPGGGLELLDLNYLDAIGVREHLPVWQTAASRLCQLE